MRQTFFYVCVTILCSIFQIRAQEEQIVVEKRGNAPENYEKPYVILISADGFRYDYMEKYQTSFLNKMAERGIKAEKMFPSFPSVTFPNHYSIATGLYPAHHGLVGNNMLNTETGARYSLRDQKAVTDPSWYGGTPIWVLAEQQKMLTACYYWPGSEAPIQNTLPTYYYRYSEKIPIEERIKQVVHWLELPEEKRPHLITFYLPEVDHAGHGFGPDAEETKKAVRFVDRSMEQLYTAVQQTGKPVYFVFVSDHGMQKVDQNHPLQFPIKVNDKELDLVSNGTYVSVFVKDKKKIKKYYSKIRKNKSKGYEAYLNEEIPEHLHFSKENDRFGRIGDIVLMAEAPYVFTNHKPLPGAHGYDSSRTDSMGATFLMWGSHVKVPEGLRLKPFENIHVYPLLARLLHLSYKSDSIDGDERLVKEIFEEDPS